MLQLLAYASEDVSVIMYYHEAINEPNAIEFIKAAIKKVNGHMDNGDWELFLGDTVPQRGTPVPSVWSMQHTHDFVMDEVVKYKACVNLHGSKQDLGANYLPLL